MKKYKIGDYINIYDLKIRDEYIDSCLNFITLQNNIKPGDKIWLMHGCCLIEAEFLYFKKCPWQDEFSSTFSCKTCKGYFWVKNFSGNLKVCVGQSGKPNSNIYRIRCQNLLEDSLFEI